MSSKEKELSDEERQDKIDQFKRDLAENDIEKIDLEEQVSEKKQKKQSKKIQENLVIAQHLQAVRVASSKAAAVNVSNAKKAYTDFQKYYQEMIQPKLNNFVKQHSNQNLTNTIVEILYVDIFNTLEKKGFIEKQKFTTYAQPQKIEKTREVKVEVEKKGFLANFFGSNGEKTIEIRQEKYFADGPSLFKKDIQDAILFDYFASKEGAKFNLDDNFNYEFSLILKKIGYKDLGMQVLDLMDNKKSHEIQYAQQTFQSKKEEISNEFKNIVAVRHVEKSVKVGPASETPGSDKLAKKRGQE